MHVEYECVTHLKRYRHQHISCFHLLHHATCQGKKTTSGNIFCHEPWRPQQNTYECCTIISDSQAPHLLAPHACSLCAQDNSRNTHITPYALSSTGLRQPRSHDLGPSPARTNRLSDAQHAARSAFRFRSLHRHELQHAALGFEPAMGRSLLSNHDKYGCSPIVYYRLDGLMSWFHGLKTERRAKGHGVNGVGSRY